MRSINRVHLNGLRAAEATARLESQLSAADELGVSVGAISQHVLKLERQIGRPLFERTSQGLRPNAMGERFLARVGNGLGEIERALAEILQDDNVLNISVAPVFAAKWLVPRLSAFSRHNPDIRVRLDASVELKHPDHGDIDLAIRVGDGDWPGVQTELLMPQEVFPVCAPEIAKHLREPRDLANVPIVRDSNSTLDWSLWLEQFGMRAADIRQGYEFTDAALALDAAIAGQGVFLGWQILATDALAAGQLVAPFAQRAPTGLGYWIVTSSTRAPPDKVARFTTWLREEITR